MHTVHVFLSLYIIHVHACWYPCAEDKEELYGTRHQEAVKIFNALLSQENLADPIKQVQSVIQKCFDIQDLQSEVSYKDACMQLNTSKVLITVAFIVDSKFHKFAVLCAQSNVTNIRPPSLPLSPSPLSFPPSLPRYSSSWLSRQLVSQMRTLILLEFSLAGRPWLACAVPSSQREPSRDTSPCTPKS